MNTHDCGYGPVPRQPLKTAKDENRPEKGQAGKRRYRQFRSFWSHPKTPSLSHSSQATWCYLWRLANEKNTCYPGLKKIAARLGCSRRTVQRAKSELKAAGFLQVVAKGTSEDKRPDTVRVVIPGIR